MLRDNQTGLYHEKYFNELLALEKKRCERSKNPVFLMLVDLSSFADVSERRKVAKSIMEALSETTRDTDVKGWHVNGLVIGSMFTEMTCKEAVSPSTLKHITNKCLGRLGLDLGVEKFSRIQINWHIFPEKFPKQSASEELRQETELPAVIKKKGAKRVNLVAKRLIDVIGSIIAIVVITPVLAGIAVWVKMSSEGPALFRQERIGFGGKTFMLLKFRSMYADNDPSVHKEFVKNLISAGNGGDRTAGTGPDGTYKIKSDPRVTPVGRILRKTSLDELPQFINVLKGDMSLVGPRPPISYECEDYDLWHRRRVLDIKPGITGLWQVTGRSVTTFDEMVRIDIKYIREWSLWLDIKIIFKTPLVMLTGDGAY